MNTTVNKHNSLIVDISIMDLISIEEELYANRILSYTNELFIRSAIHPVDSETFYGVQIEYPDLCRKGRNFFPTMAFALLHLILDSYQLDNSSCSTIIKRDPAGIDDKNLLDNDLDSNDLLIGALSKMNSGINEGLVYAFKNNAEIQNRTVEDIFHKLYIVDSVLKRLEILAIENIFPNLSKLKNGLVYHMELTKNGIFLKEKGDVIHLRYKNIIEINKKKIKEDFYNQLDKEEEQERREREENEQ